MEKMKCFVIALCLLSGLSGFAQENCPEMPAPMVHNTTMCENDSDVPYIRTNNINVKWYSTLVNPPAIPTETPLATGLAFKPFQQPGDVRQTTTFFVQEEYQGCLSPMSPVTITVIASPTMTIGNAINFCEYVDVQVKAENLVPAMSGNSYIDWQLTDERGTFSQPLTTETTNSEYFVTLDNSIIPTPEEYTLTAMYHVVTPAPNSKTCSSAPQVISVTMNPRPHKPIVASKIICEGTELEPQEAFGSPLIEWIFRDGPMELPDWVGDIYDFELFNYDQIAAGTYSFDLFDTDPATGCESFIVPFSLEVAPAAETKIVGRTELCESSFEEPYTIEVLPAKASSYFWKTSGDVNDYTKDNNAYSPSRYVDWRNAGIDTVYVMERTWAGCEGFDTLQVRIVSHLEDELCTYTAVEFVDASEIVVYPNPTTGIVNVSEAGEIKVYDSFGHLMFSTFGLQVDLSNYAGGIYFIQANGKRTRVVKK